MSRCLTIDDRIDDDEQLQGLADNNVPGCSSMTAR
jgi:hypothetical protein